MVRGLILAAVSSIALSVAHAADFEGVSMPDARVVDGTQMRLNGIGLRTFSVLGAIHQRVARENRSHSANS